MRLTSPAFRDGEAIPAEHLATHVNELPPMYVEAVPAGALSLAILIEDIDSPLGEHVTHWLVWNIPPDTTYLDAVSVPSECCVGTDTFGKVGYTGPGPLEGRHHFRFVLLALDTMLDLPTGAPRPLFDAAIEGHVIAEAELTGHVDQSAGGDDPSS